MSHQFVPIATLGLVASASAQVAAPRMSPASWDSAEVAERLAAAQAWNVPKTEVVAGADQGMVAGVASSFAAYAGVQALRNGGSATDAALTTALTQIATCGGAYVSYAGILTMVRYDAATGEVHALEASFARPLGEDSPLTIPAAPTPSGRTAMVPGFMAGVQAAHDRFGRLEFAELFEPSIWLADEGMAVDPVIAGMIASKQAVLVRLPEAKAVFYSDELWRFYAIGDTFRQPALAHTLRAVASEGASFMYTGAWGESFVEAVAAEGGAVTMEDMLRYRAEWIEPAHTVHNGIHVYAPGWPLAGGVATIEGLNLFEAAGLHDRALFTEDASSLHDFMRLSRVGHLFNHVLVEDSMVESIIAGTSVAPVHRMSTAQAEKIWTFIEGGGLDAMQGSLGGSDHSDGVVAIDSAGNVVAITHTINTSVWGDTGIVVGGVSVPDAAKFQQARLARVEPGGKLPNEMTPVIALDAEGRPVFASSTIGSGLHEATLQCLTSVLDFGVSAQDATDLPLFMTPYWVPDESGQSQWHTQVVPDSGLDADVLEGVEKLGQPLRRESTLGANAFLGYLVGVTIDPETGEKRSGVPRYFNGGAFAQ